MTLEILTKWQEKVTNVIYSMDDLVDLLKCPDAPLYEHVMKLLDAYTILVSQKVGDQYDWLGYYLCDCNLGNSPMEVLIDDERIILDSLEKLAYIIEKTKEVNTP